MRCDLVRSTAKTGILGLNECSSVNAPHQQLMFLEEKLEGITVQELGIINSWVGLI